MGKHRPVTPIQGADTMTKLAIKGLLAITTALWLPAHGAGNTAPWFTAVLQRGERRRPSPLILHVIGDALVGSGRRAQQEGQGARMHFVKGEGPTRSGQGSRMRFARARMPKDDGLIAQGR